MESWIAVTAVGRDRPGIVARVTKALLDQGCNLGETSMTRLRGEFAMILLVLLPEDSDGHHIRSGLDAIAAVMDLTLTSRELSVLPNPVLNRVCEPVDPHDPAARADALDLMDTLESPPGVGIAAPQIGQSLRIAVVDATRSVRHADSGEGRFVLLNPEVVSRE